MKPIAETNELRCESSVDAEIWAEDFIATVKKHNLTVSKGFMVGWFANAMMKMYDYAKEDTIDKAVLKDLIDKLQYEACCSECTSLAQLKRQLGLEDE